MAPSNLNQVFVANAVDMYDSTTFANNAAVTASALGVWDVDNGTYDDDAALTTKKRIQIVQTMPSGNPIASPIIDVADIVRINYKPWASVIPQVTRAVVNGGTPNSGLGVMLRIAVRTAPTAYEYYANPSNPYTDLSNGGKVFPLIGNFAAGRMIFNVEVPSATHGGSETALITALYNGVVANKTLNAIFVATDGGTGGLTLQARHYGVEFDVTCTYSDSTVYATPTMSKQTPTAASNYILAVSDEKSMRAKYGNFNRMYFPYNFPEFAQPAYKYDVIEIAYKHAHPASTGIARAAELNTIKIYVGNGSTALTADAGANPAADFGVVFGITVATASEQSF